MFSERRYVVLYIVLVLTLGEIRTTGEGTKSIWYFNSHCWENWLLTSLFANGGKVKNQSIQLDNSV